MDLIQVIQPFRWILPIPCINTLTSALWCRACMLCNFVFLQKKTWFNVLHNFSNVTMTTRLNEHDDPQKNIGRRSDSFQKCEQEADRWGKTDSPNIPQPQIISKRDCNTSIQHTTIYRQTEWKNVQMENLHMHNSINKWSVNPVLPGNGWWKTVQNEFSFMMSLLVTM